MLKINQESILTKIKQNSEYLTYAEFYSILMSILYIVINFVFWNKLTYNISNLLLNLSIIFSIILLSRYTHKYMDNKVLFLLKKIYIGPLLWVIYTQFHIYLPIINPYDYDNLLIVWDKYLFGFEVTKELYKISNPILTEFLQFCYMLHFYLPIIIGIEIIYKSQKELLADYTNKIVFGFYFSYLLYIFLPAIGPRFTLHNFATINQELPGLLLTNFFRDAVNAGGDITIGMANPETVVNRDCMPSGHTLIALLNIIMAFRYNLRMKYLILFLGGGLIFSTLYLRYHYLIDVIAGIFCTFLVLYLEPKIKNLFQKHNFRFL